ncbi:MAG TPA: hypothetical protein VFZ21_17065 [Gemmatimonadaceae bacterium]|nr:hypothetical protein [Gemmatimonadaceae bacterium]
MTTNATPRTAADMAEELQTREARQEGLRQRLSAVSGQIEQLDDASARALADGTEDPGDGMERQRLAAERDRITRALELLEQDVASLRAEGEALARAEAVAEGHRCFTVATAQADALESRLCELLTTEIFPRVAELEEALAAARRAGSQTGRAAQITEQRMPLFAFLAQCRLYLERRT